MRRFLLVTGLFFIILNGFPQFAGGNADGYGRGTTAPFTLNDQSFYCSGGDADGYSRGTTAPFTLNDQSFYCGGGDADGCDESDLAYMAPAYLLFCSGGNGDGHSSAGTGSFPFNNQSLYCSGGNGDGYGGSFTSSFPFCNQVLYCSGGNADGYQTNSSGSFSLNNQLLYCSGGGADGYHCGIVSVILNNQGLYCNGGTGDGYHLSSSSPVSLGNGIWRGITSTDWSIASNWINNLVPDETIDAVIPPGCPYYPALNAGSLSVNSGAETYKCKGLMIKSGAKVTNTGSLSALGIMIVLGEYTADNNTDRSQVVGDGGNLTLFPGGLVNLGNQSSTTGVCDLMVTNGGTVSLTGGSLYVDDQVNILEGGSITMTDGILFAHRYGIGSAYSSSSPGAFYIASGASGNISGGLVKVNGKSSDGVFSAVGIHSAGFAFSGTSVLKITDGLHADYSVSEIRTVAGANLNNLAIDKPFRTVRIGTDATLLGNLIITPASALETGTGTMITVMGNVILE